MVLSKAAVSMVCGAMALALVALPQRAEAWGTAEHIRFGERIADVFEGLLGEVLPVIRVEDGPSTFGHFVSAPDFGRGLLNFITGKALRGPTHCGALWSEDGLVGGLEIDDELLQEAAKGNVPDVRGALDCVENLRLNNSHFGDFAANHYSYYHALAIEAARRYRATRQPTCRSAAYTLEGWGQHYLTDSVAAGHAFNPPGAYGNDDLELLQTATGYPQRLRIHNELNKTGVRMHGPFYMDGTYWGDHSERKTEDGLSVPNQERGAQLEFTMRLAQMGLGQVVAAAECGAAPDPQAVLASHDPIDDPRRIYASNESMCGAMYGYEAHPDIPNIVNTFGLSMRGVKDAFVQCKKDQGQLSSYRDGLELAKHYFPDMLPSGADDGWVSDAIDSQAMLTLEDLDCLADAEVAPVAEERDICGNVLCQNPRRSDGSCEVGQVFSGGCCVTLSEGDGRGDVQFSEWFEGPTFERVELEASGAASGGAAEFLQMRDSLPSYVNTAAPMSSISSATFVELGGDGPPVEACGAEADFTVYEATLTAPANPAYEGQVVTLVVFERDEGLRVQVDGHVVAYIDASMGPQVSIPLVMPGDGAAGKKHVVRLTHLNNCGKATPLRVSFSMSDAKEDGLGDNVDSEGGCSVGGQGGGAVILLVGMALAVMRRRRDGN